MDAFFDSACSGGGCDALGVWVAALLTILVWSYLIRDTLFFRIASSLLVGTAIGYVGAVVIKTVLWDGLVAPLVADANNFFLNTGLLVIPLILGFSLLFKLTPNFRATTFSNIGLAYLFGIGAALAIGGALSGALVPQLLATMVSLKPEGDDLGWVNSALIVIGTLGAFLAFRFIQPRDHSWQRAYSMLTAAWGTIGRGFIMVAFGAILASLIAARVSALVGQLYFLLHDWLTLIK